MFRWLLKWCRRLWFYCRVALITFNWCVQPYFRWLCEMWEPLLCVVFKLQLCEWCLVKFSQLCFGSGELALPSIFIFFAFVCTFCVLLSVQLYFFDRIFVFTISALSFVCAYMWIFIFVHLHICIFVFDVSTLSSASLSLRLLIARAPNIAQAWTLLSNFYVNFQQWDIIYIVIFVWLIRTFLN